MNKTKSTNIMVNGGERNGNTSHKILPYFQNKQKIEHQLSFDPKNVFSSCHSNLILKGSRSHNPHHTDGAQLNSYICTLEIDFFQ